MPGPWNRQRWLAETDVAKLFGGQRERSPLLIALDNAIHGYAMAVAMHKRQALQNLWGAYDAWAASKTDPTTTIRNRTGAVAELVAWLVAEEEARMPAAEGGWGGLANCYAYAMKCPLPGGQGTPVPGRAAGTPGPGRAAAPPGAVVPYDPRWATRPAYWTALFAGIVADGQACGRPVVVNRQLAGNALPQPDNPPVHLCNNNTYLVAMVVKTDGFHFLRRDSASGLWSHKNGAQDAEVETFATLAAGSGRPVALDDAAFVDLVRTGQARFRSSFPNFSFAGYALVPALGIDVS